MDKTAAPLRVSIFAVPKAFTGHIGTIQRNAFRSWSRLPFVERIIIIGNEIGTAEAAESIGATHLPDVKLDDYGTPLLDDVFRLASEAAPTEWLLYSNSDILLTRRFAESAAMAASVVGPGLIVSRRWNAEIIEEFQYTADWEQQFLIGKARESLQLFNEWGIDVFLFPKGLFGKIPPFALGKTCWDNWLLNTALKRGNPITDITEEATVIHQNHSYAGVSSLEELQRTQQGLRNFWLAGDTDFGFSSICDATHVLKAGAIVPTKTPAISVVISNVDNSDELQTCIRSLCYQSYPRGHFEIIVVENAGGFAGAVARHEFPFVKFTREAEPGEAAARNKGAAIATGAIIAFLNANCRPAGDWLEKATKAAQAEDCQCIVACNIQNGTEKAGIDFGAQAPGAEIAAAMLVPASVWRKVGPFATRNNEVGHSDWEWARRASTHGVLFVYAEDAVLTGPAQVVPVPTLGD